MKVNVKQELIGVSGEKLTDKDGKAATVRDVICGALFASEAKDWETKVKNGKLAEKVSKEDEPDLEANEIITIQQAVGTVYNTITSFAMYKILK